MGSHGARNATLLSAPECDALIRASRLTAKIEQQLYRRGISDSPAILRIRANWRPSLGLAKLKCDPNIDRFRSLDQFVRLTAIWTYQGVISHNTVRAQHYPDIVQEASSPVIK